jgi:hypothetical protein
MNIKQLLENKTIDDYIKVLNILGIEFEHNVDTGYAITLWRKNNVEKFVQVCLDNNIFIRDNKYNNHISIDNITDIDEFSKLVITVFGNYNTIYLYNNN